MAKRAIPHFSLEDSRKLLRKAQMLQTLIKTQVLIKDSLLKLRTLLKNTNDKHEALLLTQVANNMLKVQTKLEAVERYIEKTLPENSSGENFRG